MVNGELNPLSLGQLTQRAVMEQHPSLPLIAVSGIDHTAKVSPVRPKKKYNSYNSRSSLRPLLNDPTPPSLGYTSVTASSRATWSSGHLSHEVDLPVSACWTFWPSGDSGQRKVRMENRSAPRSRTSITSITYLCHIISQSLYHHGRMYP